MHQPFGDGDIPLVPGGIKPAMGAGEFPLKQDSDRHFKSSPNHKNKNEGKKFHGRSGDQNNHGTAEDDLEEIHFAQAGAIVKGPLHATKGAEKPGDRIFVAVSPLVYQGVNLGSQLLSAWVRGAVSFIIPSKWGDYPSVKIFPPVGEKGLLTLQNDPGTIKHLMERLRKKREPKQKGQLSIFFGIALMVIMSMIAFIVNVGLFVNAKINLQNAVDAAAWAGAAVQARQLTNIAYLNWELRNNYKEWLFKYYIIGQASNASAMDTSGSQMRFRPVPFATTQSDPSYMAEAYSRYNAPTICIHPGGAHNICNMFGLPGLPRFNTVGLPAISEHNESFINKIAATKSKDCSRRSQINFSTAMKWVYGTGAGSLGTGGVQIAADRVGAWPRALELALRMRNLEMLVNRPPVEGQICTSSGAGCVPIGELQQDAQGTPTNERPVKAFLSAWRNLSGGYDDDPSPRDLKNSFKLTELAPEPYNAADNKLSDWLIDTDFEYEGGTGTSAITKHYLDLQIQPIHLIEFYTSFVSTTGDFNKNIKAEAACSSSKTAIPVPGFIMGFIKNPDVLTYYAVKGEAKFTGLFFPFTTRDGITMTAYAAAKPFGGRIGPRLFNLDDAVLKPRTGDQSRSVSFVAGLEPPTGGYKAGFPIPVAADFYVRDSSDPVGGVPDASNPDVKFAVPNMIYEYIVGGSMSGLVSVGDAILAIKEHPGKADSETNPLPSEVYGLYNTEQFRALKANAPTLPGSISGKQVREGIISAKRPTKWDALNYMVPTFDNESKGLESVSIVKGDEITFDPPLSGSYVNYKLFAPLFGDYYLYNAKNKISAIVGDFMKGNEVGITKFLKGLCQVAETMRSLKTRGTDPGAGNSYADAANGIHPNVGNVAGDVAACDAVNVTDSGLYKMHKPTPQECEKNSMAHNFRKLFFADVSGVEECGIAPISTLVADYIVNLTSNDATNIYYNTEYALPDGDTQEFMTGYMPGPRRGASNEGKISHPFSGQFEVTAKRNYYSTKLIAMVKVSEKTGALNFYKKAGQASPPYRENINQSPDGGVITSPEFKNVLRPGQLSEFGNELHF